MRIKKKIEKQSKKILSENTIRELAKKIDYPETTLWRKLNGLTKMDIDLIDKLEEHGFFNFKEK